jgi:translocation and assembly module TamB
VLDGSDKRLALGLTDLRLSMNAHDGTWYFTQALAGPTLGEVGGAVRVRTTPERRWPEPGAPLDGALQARVANLGVWGAWVPPGWRLQGQLATQAQLGGTVGAPQLTGSLDGRGLGARNLLLGVNVRDGEVAVRLEGDRATVDRFVLRAGDGELRLSGGATLGAEPAVQLALTAERLQVLGRIDRRLVVSGQARFELDAALLSLDGDLRVDSGAFDVSRGDAPSLDEDVVVLRQGTPPPAPAQTAVTAPPRRTLVRIGVDLGDKLRLRGRGLDTRLAGQLRVSAPGGRLAVNGSVNTVGGSFAGYGQKMVIERGQLAFSGPPDSPRMDVLALRPGLDVEVGVEIIGSVNAPRVRLYSNPDMSDTDKLSWLVLGREPGAAGRADTALLQRAAVALLSGEGESTSDQVIRSIGLDNLSVRQDDVSQETVVSLGKQISERWYLGYERSISATQGTWQVIYRAAKRFTLRAESGLDQSLDAIWVWQVP